MALTRRDFFRGAGALAALSAAMPRLAFAKAASTTDRGVLLVIFQRGGMDGLNVVVPHGDADYYRLRPGIGIPRPGTPNGAIDLDGFFGLNPALSPLLPLYQAGELALVQATGYRHDSRSHFECQDHIERGTLHLHDTPSGWLNRHLAVVGGDANFQAIGFGGAIQASLRGMAPVIGVNDIADFTLATDSVQKGVLQSALERLYDASTLLAATSVQALDAVDELAEVEPAQFPVEGGASYPTGRFGSQLRELAQIIKAGMGLEVACVDIGGWDHHAAIGQVLPPLLTELAQGLLAFRTDLGARMADVTVVTVTEFGRRAYQNASGGTDHGSAFSSLVLGGGVNGGRVYADWPGLRDADLFNGDLDVTIDYRTWLGELLEKRAGNPEVASVFPGFTSGPGLGLFRSRF
ncbi:MAG TPA: DUF1501 domain-containing protein [Patescibacteria group bacterium]|nr:DUF1501 domain-containing protein [Patescibacteria group bacterium]